MFLQLNWGILWPIINIIVFYLLLRKFLFGPVSEIMEKKKRNDFQRSDGCKGSKR